MHFSHRVDVKKVIKPTTTSKYNFKLNVLCVRTQTLIVFIIYTL